MTEMWPWPKACSQCGAPIRYDEPPPLAYCQRCGEVVETIDVKPEAVKF